MDINKNQGSIHTKPMMIFDSLMVPISPANAIANTKIPMPMNVHVTISTNGSSAPTLIA